MCKKNNTSLAEFLDYFDFGYAVYDIDGTKEIGLTDSLGANLGGIQDERYSMDKNGLSSIIDRLDIYYQDYIFDDLKEKLEKDYDIDGIEKCDWKMLYEKAKEAKISDYMDILPVLFGESELVFNEKGPAKENPEDEEALDL